MEDGELQSGERARLARWFRRLAETSFQKSWRTRDGFANARDGRAPQNGFSQHRVIQKKCRTAFGPSGIVQQRLNCALLVVFSLSPDSLSRFGGLTACLKSRRISGLAVDLVRQTNSSS